MSVSFGDVVRRGREEAGLSQSRLALLIGKSPTTIRAWEHGRTHPADPDAVSALAAVLGLDEADLLGKAGFEAPAARTRPSARQELNDLASERTEMIALTPPAETPAPIKPVKPLISEPDLLDLPLPMEPATTDPAVVESVVEPISEAEVDVKPVTIDPEQNAATPAEVFKLKVRMPRVAALKTREPEPRVPKPRAPKPRAPKPRVIVTQQGTPGPGSAGPTSPTGSNGYLGGRSYLEDEAEKDFYRRRGVITALVLVFMVIVIWWALGRTGGAIGDLIESLVGLLDI